MIAIGIEIGGTKLQVGLGTNPNGLSALARSEVDPALGAVGIRQRLVTMVPELLADHGESLATVNHIGIGFGGPVDTARGLILKSFQIEGWDNFPLRAWAEAEWGRPVIVQNDASVAGLAEVIRGNGRGYRRIFYLTIGSGVGGGWIVDDTIDEGQGLGAAEIGHMWLPDPDTGQPQELERICSGWAIGRRARAAAQRSPSRLADLAGSPDQIDAKAVYVAAAQGDPVATRILSETCHTLGIALSNLIALLHPERIVIGGGVSLMGPLFWSTLREQVRVRCLPLFAPQVELVPAALGEEVVVVGAICLAQMESGRQ